MALIAAVLIGLSVYALARIPTGFIPWRTRVICWLRAAARCCLPRAHPGGVGASPRGAQDPGGRACDHDRGRVGLRWQCLACQRRGHLPHAQGLGRALQDQGPGPEGLYANLRSARADRVARVQVVPPPPIQGIGMSGGFQMQVELTDGSFDYSKLQRVSDLLVSDANTQTGLERVMTPFRADVPQITADIDRAKAQALGRAGGERVRHPAELPRLDLHQPDHQVRPRFPVFVQADSATASPRRTSALQRAQPEWLDGADRHARGCRLHPGTGAHQPLQPVPVELDQRHDRRRLQLRAVAADDG